LVDESVAPGCSYEPIGQSVWFAVAESIAFGDRPDWIGVAVGNRCGNAVIPKAYESISTPVTVGNSVAN
jgi:hypothetical protein